jgi:hypothetical protein
MTARYWVRLNEHLTAETAKSLVGVLSLYALGLKDGQTDREYIVDLIPKKRTPAEFEREMNNWVRSGFITWRKLDEPSHR